GPGRRGGLRDRRNRTDREPRGGRLRMSEHVTGPRRPVAAPSGWRSVAGSLLSDKYALIGAWLGVIVLFSILRPDTFATSANASSILSSQGVLVVVSLAVVVPLIVGEFDLSVGAVLALAA